MILRSTFIRISDLLLASSVVDGRGSRLIVVAKPERDAEADQQDGAQQEENDGLLQPGYRGNGKAHRKTEESDLRKQKIDARKERAQRK